MGLKKFLQSNQYMTVIWWGLRFRGQGRMPGTPRWVDWSLIDIMREMDESWFQTSRGSFTMHTALYSPVSVTERCTEIPGSLFPSEDCMNLTVIRPRGLHISRVVLLHCRLWIPRKSISIWLTQQYCVHKQILDLYDHIPTLYILLHARWSSNSVFSFYY